MAKSKIWLYIAAKLGMLSDAVSKNIKISGQYLSILAIVGVAALVLGTAPALAALPGSLGTAGSFAVLAGSGITNTGSTTIIGDVGTFPTPSETGFDSVTLAEINHAGDAVTQGAKNDLINAYNDAVGGSATTVATELGGTTKNAGVYNSASGTFGITGTLTLDAQGNPNAVFIFQTISTVITASNSVVNLINGAQPCNVFWQVGSSATLGTGTIFAGNILASESITLNTGATISGRTLAQNGAVTMDTNTITTSACSAPSTSAPALIKSFSPANINTGGVSTLTITLSNPSTSDALNAQLIDNFPNGMVIATPMDITNTCGGVIGAIAGGNNVTLTGGLIPGSDTCTVKVKVTANTAGPHDNTLPIGALQTNIGSNIASASSTLTVETTPSPIPEFPTVALPVIAVIGLVFLYQRRKGE